MPSASESPLLGWVPLSGIRPEAAAPPTTTVNTTPTPPPPGAADASAFLSVGPPQFQRVPRAYVEPPRDTLEISMPPALPLPPSTAQWTLVLAISVAIASVAGIGFYAYVSYQASQNVSVGTQISPMAQLWWLPLLSGLGTLGSIGGIVQQFAEPRRYRRELARRDQGYRAYINTCCQELQRLREAQRAAALTLHPPLSVCRELVAYHDRRLWERSADRDVGRDLLDLRLGIGGVPATFSVKAPQAHGFHLDADPLRDLAQQLVRTHASISDAPVVLPLAQVGAVGITGDRRQCQRLTSALLIQLATHHAPNEVKLVLCYPEQEAAHWAWVRWLPHVWSDDRSQRTVAATPEQARQVLVSLTGVLKQRQFARQSSDGQSSLPLPLYVVVFADPALLNGSEAKAFAELLKLLESGPLLGAYALFLHDRAEQVRKQCGAIVDLARNALCIVGPPSVETPFMPDELEAIEAERFARTIAPLRTQNLSAKAELPQLITLLDMFGVQRVEDLPILKNWQTSQPFKSLAAPIGVRVGGDLVLLDFHERGHGPHGLGAGTTGAGKSELLQTLVVSLATRFHPHELAFVLIDYKGGGMAAPFRELPHQVGIITNLEASLVPRAINALKVENERRQRLLDQAGVNNIDAYQPLYRAGKVAEPLPHLLVLADEFAELAQNQPELMDRLISVARVGRSLGVHLLLATQKPAGIVNDQIWSNSNFRLCLRVAQPEDSQELLKRPDAALIPSNQPGRGYLQVGQNELFELFQSAYSGAPYAPGAGTTRATVALVRLDGGRKAFQMLADSSAGSGANTVPSQLQALVTQIKLLADQQQIAPLAPPWLPPLPEQLALSRVRAGRTAGWNGRGWQPNPGWLQPVIGLVDDPAHRIQEPLTVALADGHVGIYGAPGSGKTTLLQTLVLSLALEHTPDQVNLYLLDFGGRRLKIFEPLPHVGSIVLPGANEHVARLFAMLLREIEHRKDELVSAGESSFAAYHRRIAGAPPAIVVMIDNYTAFANDYPEQAEELVKVASEGGNLGIHLVLAAGTTNAIPLRLANSLALALALELNDSGEYPIIVGRTDGLLPAKGVRGRGLLRATPPLEFQTAQPSDQSGDRGLRELIAQIGRAWTGAKARP
ncbi:MAG: type VII secretion protein EssC, partial [Chloroflexales bacterium]